MKIKVSAILTEFDCSNFASKVTFIIETKDSWKIQEQLPIKEPIMLTIETKDTPPAVSDGTTLWAINDDQSVLFAYDSSTHLRDSSRDIYLIQDPSLD